MFSTISLVLSLSCCNTKLACSLISPMMDAENLNLLFLKLKEQHKLKTKITKPAKNLLNQSIRKQLQIVKSILQTIHSRLLQLLQLRLNQIQKRIKTRESRNRVSLMVLDRLINVLIRVLFGDFEGGVTELGVEISKILFNGSTSVD